MKFGAVDRLLQLGVAPVVTKYLKKKYPDVSASLWQKQAKSHHRRLVADAPELPADTPFARQCRASSSFSLLMLGFHEAAPSEADFTVEDFGALVDLALSSPVVPIVFGSVDLFSHEGARDVQAFLNASADSTDTRLFAGDVRAQKRDDGSTCYACEVTRCGLVRTLAVEHRFFLLPCLCKVEDMQAALCGGTLCRTSCIATGSKTCDICLERRDA